MSEEKLREALENAPIPSARPSDILEGDPEWVMAEYIKWYRGERKEALEED